ncbi:YdcF family protein [Paremcibacter congregatus]|uniref:YdcF family protein n=1 Tax=Paremcibacter congregatus TaxID=2043170 RepID=UPI0030EDE52C|tara:strand:+ start:6696 stop:7340 length:645 start_codon:yes stop_codon:yes gene_type:complete
MIRFVLKTLSYLILLVAVVWTGGFFYYIYGLSQVAAPDNQKTDGIVVLTGGKDRLRESARLLQEGLAARLFISGVNVKVTTAELIGVLGVPDSLAECCIESGKQARNTVGNAEEIAAWVARRKLTSIRVVTSLEHMPRTLLEMRRVMPNLAMVSHPVGQWRPENIRFMSLVREYSKYLASRIWYWLLDFGAENVHMDSTSALLPEAEVNSNSEK